MLNNKSNLLRCKMQNNFKDTVNLVGCMECLLMRLIEFIIKNISKYFLNKPYTYIDLITF